MIKLRCKRLMSVLICMVMIVFSIAVIDYTKVSAADLYKFDLGANSENGYTSVSAAQNYSNSLGYGFSNTEGVKNVNASGNGALSDAVQFTDNSTTFNVDLPKGLYKIDVTLGDTSRTSIYMENMLQIVNMTGNNAYDSITIPVTDGQLNIRAAAGRQGYPFSISEVDITKISDDPVMPRTVWFCGDSTVCNYYPRETSVQAGWGQVINQYIDTNIWQVRDMAASGQYAKGFVDAGQFDAIEYYGKEGDIYIISIGINDTNYSNADEYYSVVTDMVKRAKAKGMTVYLVKQQGRAGDVTNNPKLTGRWFGTQLDQIGNEQNVKVIDLFNLFFDYCKSIGQEQTNALYMDGDTLHPNRQGAMKLAELASKEIDWSGIKQEEGAEIDTEKTYRIKNKNSGLYMSVENSMAENGVNVSQQNDTEINSGNVWTLKKADDGYYYISSTVGNGEYLLDLANGKIDSGTNIAIFKNTNSDAQLFKFIDNKDGSYVITTKVTKDQSAIEVKDALMTSGGNIQQWQRNGHNCQLWILEPAVYNVFDSDDIIVGDVNHDGKVNVFDYIIIKRNNSFNGLERQFADTNSDGLVDNADVKAMGSFLVKKDNFEAVKNSSRFYYADEASFSKGVTENVNAGFKKNGYLNLDNCEGSFVEWNVNAPEKGNYLCTFSIANGTNVNRIMKIEVNGSTDYWMQDFLSTNSWTSWEARGIVLPLNKGKNIIRMSSASEQGGPNIDSLHLEKTEEPIAEVYIPPQKPEPPIQNNKTIFIAGDSTVQTYRASYAPQQGWGAYLQDYVPEGYTVSNNAIAGRSSKSFYDNGRLNTILEQMKSGDYLLVQFGINDSAYNNAERYAPTCGSVPGTEGSFEYYISKYIEGAIEKGGKPVLVTTVLGLKAYNQSKKTFEGSYTNYCDAMKQLASYYKIPCIDLNSLMVEHYNSIGYDAAYNYHLISTELSTTDMTHFTDKGAKAVAKLVFDEINKQGILK